MTFTRTALPAALTLALLTAAGSGGRGAEPLTWDASCEALRDGLHQALADAPEMALGNVSKVERLLRDARLADGRELCLLKLERAYELLEQAYGDAGRPFEVIAPTG
jgi:hypothetical protein